MPEETFDKAAAVKLLNQIMEAELAGVVRYTHYSLMVFGPSLGSCPDTRFGR